MRVHICAMGRLRAGPEKSLVDDYLTRFDRTGRGLGLGPARVVEMEDRKRYQIDHEKTETLIMTMIMNELVMRVIW